MHVGAQNVSPCSAFGRAAPKPARASGGVALAEPSPAIGRMRPRSMMPPPSTRSPPEASCPSNDLLWSRSMVELPVPTRSPAPRSLPRPPSRSIAVEWKEESKEEEGEWWTARGEGWRWAEAALPRLPRLGCLQPPHRGVETVKMKIRVWGCSISSFYTTYVFSGLF